MKGDFSRSTFRPERHYASVRQQQGRVQLDADANEAQDIVGHRLDVSTLDVVGESGAPLDFAGFGLNLDGTAKLLSLSPGRLYLNGTLVENEKAITLPAQPHLSGGWALLPDGPAQYDVATLPAGDYAVVLDVWPRHVTALEAPELLEVALGGVETTTRVQTLWQVKLMPIPAGTSCAAVTNLAAWARHSGAGTGRLLAEAELPPPAPDACDLSPSGGYQGLANQLYRVEIHKPGPAGGGNAATFKWATDNGTVATVATAWDGDKAVSVASAGRDFATAWTIGDTVELLDRETELRGLPGKLLTVADVDGNVLTFSAGHNLGAAAAGVAAAARGVRVRRWAELPAKLPGDGKAIPLGTDGVFVTFEKAAGAEYRTGDFWMIPARTATADIEWPGGLQPPLGIAHSLALLGRFSIDGSGVISGLTDCRALFPPLTAMLNFGYAGGDGQQAEPRETGNPQPIPLAEPLRVSVTRGLLPVAGARVGFEIDAGAGGSLGVDSAGTVSTGADGIAACDWALDAKIGDAPQRVVARLLDDALQPVGAPIRFGARVLGLLEMRLNGGDTQTIVRQTGGQGAAELPAPLSVAVLRAGRPAAGQKVRFEIVGGAGTLNGGGGPVTDQSTAEGIAECKLALAPGADSVQVRARLMQTDAIGWGLPDVVFTASALTVAEGGGCDVTIGEGGQFASVKDALPVLIEAGVQTICLCFRPGVHVEKNPLQLPVDPKMRLALHGCGPASILQLPGIEFAGLDSVEIRDLVIRTRKNGLSFIRTNAVSLRNVDLDATAAGFALRYATVSRISVESCAIAFKNPDANAIDIDHFEGVRRFVGNDIAGAISFGGGKPGNMAAYAKAVETVYRQLQGADIEPPATQMLALIDNRLTALLVGRDFAIELVKERTRMPLQSQITGNLFSANGNVIPGNGIVVDGNRFLGGGLNLLLGGMLDDSYFYIKIIGNIGNADVTIRAFGYHEEGFNRPIGIS